MLLPQPNAAAEVTHIGGPTSEACLNGCAADGTDVEGTFADNSRNGRNPTQQRSDDWKRGSRIGEAKNPGPPKLVPKDPAFNKIVGRTPNQPY